MIIRKIYLKLKKDEFFAAFAFVNQNQTKVMRELDGRNALLTLHQLSLYDYAPKMVTPSRFTAWENHDENKRYSFELPIGVAVAFMNLLMLEEETGFSLKSFGSILYTKLLNVVDPIVLDPIGPLKEIVKKSFPIASELPDLKPQVYG